MKRTSFFILIFALSVITATPALAKPWAFLSCFRLLSSPAPRETGFTEFAQVTREIPKDEIGLSHVTAWNSPLLRQPDEIFQVERSLNETDFMLWKLSQENANRETALIQVFDSEGTQIWQSQGIIGDPGSIPAELIYSELERFFDEKNSFSELSGATLRFTHTHPPGGILPQHFSPGDLGVTLQFRKTLDRVGLRETHLEMIAVTNSAYSIGEIGGIPNFKGKLGALFGSKRWAKPSMIAPGR